MPKLRMQVTAIRTDPVSYKPYSPEFAPADLWVEIEVEGRVEQAAIVQTPEQFSELLEQIADTIEEMDYRRKAK